MKLVQYNEYLISIVDTDALVLQHQGISSHSAKRHWRLPRASDDDKSSEVMAFLFNSLRPSDAYMRW